MVEVKLFLYDAIEVNMLAQFEHVLTQKRLQQPAAAQNVGEQSPPAPQQPESTPAQSTEPAPLPAPTPTASLSNDAENVSPLRPTPVPETVDDITLMNTVTAYANKHGVPATRLKIEAFGAATAMQIPEDKRAEFVRSLA